VFGNEPLYELSGGSIPITYTLKHLLEIDSLMMGYGLPDDGLHSPNEKLSVEMFEKGIATNIEFLTNIALVK
jgi:acetylornithine deacetylase/succinyl-diaminopimelate desuccinylase-like protein